MEWGKWAEDIAAGLLREKGYKILERNYRASYAEIDILARDGEELVCVEVKMRRSEDFGTPEYSVNTKKQNNLAFALGHYINELSEDPSYRFDVVAITAYDRENYKTDHIKNAFFPGWE